MTAESPLISSSVTGPLGVMHLPRLWWKILLHGAGLLPEGYRYGEGGFDDRLCTAIGIDRPAFVDYVMKEKPNYIGVEAWVRANATKLTPEAIAEWNAHIVDTQRDEDRAAPLRAQLGIADTGFTNAVLLNDLDDWAAAHARLTGKSYP